jgi:hypothetical protein
MHNRSRPIHIIRSMTKNVGLQECSTPRARYLEQLVCLNSKLASFSCAETALCSPCFGEPGACFDSPSVPSYDVSAHMWV